MTRLFIALLLILVPVSALGYNQTGIVISGSMGGKMSSNGDYIGTEHPALLLEGLHYFDNFLLDVTYAPDWTEGLLNPQVASISFGYIFGENAASPRIYFLAGAEGLALEDEYYGGPKLSFGLAAPIGPAMLVLAGLETSYFPYLEELSCRGKVGLALKWGATYVTEDMAAGGETPYGLFPGR